MKKEIVIDEMTDSTVLSVRIDSDVKKRFAKLASSLKRSQSFLAAEAIEEFLAVQEWQIAGIEAALASADAGKHIAHDEVRDWISSLGTEDERPLPTSV
ncbi:CopG family ribbon-helix-helix protein [uncultured Sneathiella sp.]|uniref:CopG family ribbon-helix-helix protein n=1 Tax=uncultured Sneathiella sp. TaxID=879315 RepID=UPI0030EB6122|tara:strand:+ start:16339 stop:16635 length:297 start_codon:yes stop_codon:yes gene_type:complete